jgi:hypothetical protein
MGTFRKAVDIKSIRILMSCVLKHPASVTTAVASCDAMSHRLKDRKWLLAVDVTRVLP